MSFGIAPKLQQAALKFAWPTSIRSFILHPAGPFTSIFVSWPFLSLLLGTYFQVDDHDFQHRRHWATCREHLNEPATRNRFDWSHLGEILNLDHASKLQPACSQLLHGFDCHLLIVPQDANSWRKRWLLGKKESLINLIQLNLFSLNSLRTMKTCLKTTWGPTFLEGHYSS